MKPKITYIADLDQDIDDFLAILYLYKYDALSYVVCDPWHITEEGKQRLDEIGHMNIVCFDKIQLETKIVFCGGALTGVANFIKAGNSLDALAMNGGYVGCNIIAVKEQLPKFKYKDFVRTYNFNLDINSTKEVLSMSDEQISRIILVGKHLCHNEINTVSGIWSSIFFKELREKYKFDNKKRLHDVLACHEGLSLLGIIPDGTYCEYRNYYPKNIDDKWGTAVHPIYKEDNWNIYRKCEIAVRYK